MNNKTYCLDCGDECSPVAESFDYSGSHCTHGKGGTHYTRNYLSDCCHAELTDEPKLDSGDLAENNLNDTKAEQIENCTDLETLKALYQQETKSIDQECKELTLLTEKIRLLKNEAERLEGKRLDWHTPDYPFLIERQVLKLILGKQ